MVADGTAGATSYNICLGPRVGFLTPYYSRKWASEPIGAIGVAGSGFKYNQFTQSPVAGMPTDTGAGNALDRANTLGAPVTFQASAAQVATAGLNPNTIATSEAGLWTTPANGNAGARQNFACVAASITVQQAQFRSCTPGSPPVTNSSRPSSLGPAATTWAPRPARPG